MVVTLMLSSHQKVAELVRLSGLHLRPHLSSIAVVFSRYGNEKESLGALVLLTEVGIVG